MYGQSKGQKEFTVIDTYSKVAFIKLYDRKNALVTAEVLNDKEYLGSKSKKYCYRKIPWQTFQESKHLAQAKMLDEMHLTEEVVR